MRKLDQHYHTIPELYARRHFEELTAGYEAAYRAKRLPAIIEGDPYHFFTGSRYCREIYEHVRAQLANSKAWSIGWAVAEEELRDAVAPVQTLAELFMTEKYA